MPASLDPLAKHFAGWPGWFDWAQIALVLVGGFFLIRLSIRALDAVAERRHFDALAFRPFRELVRWIGLLLILSLILGKFGFDMFTALSTVLALIAVGFVAVWSVLSNFLCTFLLILFRPFRIDEYIEIPGDEGIRGRVVELSALFTVLEDDDGTVFQVPNNQFFQKAIKKPRREKKSAV
ncbi:MAG: mechanosensitive ion channel family protein [Terrimicrobiaceae bacterium]